MSKISVEQIQPIEINNVQELTSELYRIQNESELYTKKFSIEKDIVAQWVVSGNPRILREYLVDISGRPVMQHIVDNYDRDQLGKVLFLSVLTSDIDYNPIIIEDLRFDTLAELNSYLLNIPNIIPNNGGAFTFTFYRKIFKGIRQNIVPYNLMYSMLVGRKHLADTTTSLNYLIEEDDGYHVSSSTVRRLVQDLYSNLYNFTVQESEMLDAVMTITKKANKKNMFNLTPNTNIGKTYIDDRMSFPNRRWFDETSRTFVDWIDNLDIVYGDSWYWAFPLQQSESALINAHDFNDNIFRQYESFIKVQQLKTVINGHTCVAFRVSPIGYDTIVINGFVDPLFNERDISYEGRYSVYMSFQDRTSGRKISLVSQNEWGTDPARKFCRILPKQWKAKLTQERIVNKVQKKSIKFFILNKETGISFVDVITLDFETRVRGALIKPMIRL